MLTKMELFWRLTLAFALLGLVAKCEAATDATNYFVWPPAANGTSPTDGGSYNESVALTWSESEMLQFHTDYISYTVDMYQNFADATPDGQHQFVKTIKNHIVNNSNYPIDTIPTGDTTLPWTVNTYTASVDRSPVFFFWIQNADDPTQSEFFMSHYFNITAGTSSSTTSTVSTTSTSSTTTATSTDVVNPSATASSAVTTNAPENGEHASSSPTTTIAVGVGVGVGVLILLALFFLAFKLGQKRKRSALNDTLQAASKHNSGLSGSSSVVDSALENDNSSRKCHEIPDHAVHEAPIRQREQFHEVPDHAIVEAPGDDKPPVELPSTRRFSWER